MAEGPYIALPPLDELVTSDEFSAFPTEEKISQVDKWFKLAEPYAFTPEDQKKFGFIRNKVYDDIYIEDFNRNVRESLPEEIRNNDEDYEAQRQNILQVHANESVVSKTHDRNLNINDILSPAIDQTPRPSSQLTDEGQIAFLASQAMKGIALPPLYPSDQEKVKQRVRELKGDVADFGLESDIEFGGESFTEDANYSEYNKALRDSGLGSAAYPISAESSLGTNALRKSARPAFDSLARISEQKRTIAEMSNWRHVDDSDSPDASNRTLFSVRRSAHPSRNDLYDVRLGDRTVVQTDKIGSDSTGQDMMNFLAENRDAFDDGQWEALEYKFGKNNPGVIEMSYDTIFRGAAGITGGVGSILQSDYTPGDEGGATGFTAPFKLIGAAITGNAAEIRKRHQASSETLEAGAFGFDTPEWWLERGGEVAVQLAGQFAGASMMSRGARAAGFSASAQAGFATSGFAAAAYVPQAGNIYRESFEYGLESGLSKEDAHDVARVEAVIVGAATAGLEQLSGHVLLGDKAATAAVSGAVRKIMSRVPAGAIGAFTEGSTESMQEIAAIVGESLIRGDDRSLDNERAILDKVMSGNFGAIRGSRTAAAGFLGAGAGGAIGFARGSDVQPNAPSLPQDEDGPTAPDIAGPDPVELQPYNVLQLQGGGHRVRLFNQKQNLNYESFAEETTGREEPRISPINFTQVEEIDFSGPNSAQEAAAFGSRYREYLEAREAISAEPDSALTADRKAHVSEFEVELNTLRKNQENPTIERSFGSYSTYIKAKGEAKKIATQLGVGMSDVNPARVLQTLNDLAKIAQAKKGGGAKAYQSLPQGRRALADQMARLSQKSRERYAGLFALGGNAQPDPNIGVREVQLPNGQTRYEVVFNQPTTAPVEPDLKAEEVAARIEKSIADGVQAIIDSTVAEAQANATDAPLVSIINAAFEPSGTSAQESAQVFADKFIRDRYEQILSGLEVEMDSLIQGESIQDQEIANEAIETAAAEGDVRSEPRAPRADVPNRQPQVVARERSIRQARTLRRGEQGSTIIFDEIARMAIDAIRAGANFAKFSADAVARWGQDALQFAREVWSKLAKVVGDQVTAFAINQTPARLQDEDTFAPLPTQGVRAVGSQSTEDPGVTGLASLNMAGVESSSPMFGSGDIEIQGGNMERAMKMFGVSLYSANIGRVIGKELFQNSVDAVKKAQQLHGTNPAIAYGPIGEEDQHGVAKSQRFVMVDNGVGMSPDIILTKFLRAFTSGKSVGDGGGFGLAKLAFLGGTRNFEIETTAIGPDGRKYKTRLVGTGEGFFGFNSRQQTITPTAGSEIDLSNGRGELTMSYNEVDPGTPTGTVSAFDISEDDNQLYEAGSLVGNALKYVDGVDFYRLTDGSVPGGWDDKFPKLENSGIIESAATMVSRPDRLAQGAEEVVYGIIHSGSVPGADFDILAKQGAKSRMGQYFNPTFLNRSIMQFTDAIQTIEEVYLPADLVVNVKPTVEAGTEDYPFTTNREQINDKLKKEIQQFFSKVGAVARQKINDRYLNTVDSAPVIDGDYVLLDASGAIDGDMVKEVAESEYVRNVLADVEQVQNAVLKMLAKKYPQSKDSWGSKATVGGAGGSSFGRAVLAGLLTGGNAYGVHFGKKGSTEPTKIFHDIWLEWEYAKDQVQDEFKEAGEPFTNGDVYDQFIITLAGVALHEALHQTIGEEGERLARGLTFKAGELVQALASVITTKLNDEQINEIAERIETDAERLKAQGDQEEAGKLIVSFGGYDGYAMARSPGEDQTGEGAVENGPPVASGVRPGGVSGGRQGGDSGQGASPSQIARNERDRRVFEANAERRRNRTIENRKSQIERNLAPERRVLKRSGQITGTDEQFVERLKTQDSFLDKVFGTASKYIGVLSTEVGNIHPMLREAFRHFETMLHRRRHAYTTEVLPFSRGYSALPKRLRQDMDHALKNGDYDTVNEIAGERGFASSIQPMRDVLEKIRQDYKGVGRELNFVRDYFPRRVSNYKRFQEFLYGTEAAGLIRKELDKHERKNGTPLTADEREEIVNRYLSKVVVARGNPANLKSRTITEISRAMSEYYVDSSDALASYIGDAVRDIESRRFFGEDARVGSSQYQTFDRVTRGSIGGIVQDLLAQGEINHYQEATIRDAINSRIGYTPTSRALAGVRDLSHSITIANPVSAIIQIADVAVSAAANGYWNTLGVIGKVAVDATIRQFGGKGIFDLITREDLGIDRASIELEGGSFLHKALNGGFVKGVRIPGLIRLSGFDLMDSIGKEAFANSYIKKLGKMSDEEVNIELAAMAPLLRTSPEQVARDAREGVASEDLFFAAFSKLSNYQPVSLSEMPRAYLDNPNGRLLYMLKSFTIKQMDVLRREVIQEIRAGNVKDGLVRLVWLAVPLVAGGAAAEEVKQFILGRDIKFSENVINNMVRLIGLSRYNAEGVTAPFRKAFDEDLNVKPKAFSDLVYGTFFSLPILNLGDRTIKTMGDVIGAYQDGDKKVTDAVRKSALWQLVPVVGSIYHDRWGGGNEKEKARFLEQNREEYADQVEPIEKRQESLRKVKEASRSDSQKEEYASLNRFMSIKRHYEKVMKESLESGDPNLMESAKKRIRDMAANPELWAAEYDTINPPKSEDKPIPYGL